jgi:hypothetical protein
MKNSIRLLIACILSISLFSSCSLINKTCSTDCAKNKTENEEVKSEKTEKKAKKAKKAKKTEVQPVKTEVKN